MHTDEAIIRLFFQRDQEAIHAAADKYGPGCTGIATNILHDRADAEECVNDTWLAAWNAIPPERPDPLRAYLFRIVRNLATARFHRNRAQKRDSSYDLALSELEDCLAAPAGVEDALTARELTQILNRFLADLDRDSRILFLRRYWYGDAVQNLAAQLGQRPNTVTARLARLREKLRRTLAKEGYQV